MLKVCLEKNKTNNNVKNDKPSWVGHPYHFSPWEPLLGMRSLLLQLFAAVLHKQQIAVLSHTAQNDRIVWEVMDTQYPAAAKNDFHNQSSFPQMKPLNDVQ